VVIDELDDEQIFRLAVVVGDRAKAVDVRRVGEQRELVLRGLEQLARPHRVRERDLRRQAELSERLWHRRGTDVAS